MQRRKSTMIKCLWYGVHAMVWPYEGVCRPPIGVCVCVCVYAVSSHAKSQIIIEQPKNLLVPLVQQFFHCSALQPSFFILLFSMYYVCYTLTWTISTQSNTHTTKAPPSKYVQNEQVRKMKGNWRKLRE